MMKYKGAVSFLFIILYHKGDGHMKTSKILVAALVISIIAIIVSTVALGIALNKL